MSKYSDKLKRRAEAKVAAAAENAEKKHNASRKTRGPSFEVIPLGTLPKSVKAALIAAGRFVEAVENCKDDFKSYAYAQKGWTKTVALNARLVLIAAVNSASSAAIQSAPFIAKAEEEVAT